MPRWITCGSANTWSRSLIGPAGMVAASSLSKSSSRLNCAVSAQSLPTSSVAMGKPAFVVLVGRHRGELRRAEDAAQFDELRVVAGGDDDAAVGDGKLLIGHEIGMRIADALGHFAGHQIIERLERQRADGGIDQRGIDVTAAAGVLAPRQRGKDADRRIDAGENIGDRHADPHRRPVGRAGHAHDAADALRHQIVAGARRRRAGLAEAGHRAIDQPRIKRREAFIVEAEFDEPADLEVLDQHVGAGRELLDDALAFGRGEIERDRALAAIGRVKIGRSRDGRRRPPARTADPRRGCRRRSPRARP